MRVRSAGRSKVVGGKPEADKAGRRWPRSPQALDRRVVNLLSASDRPLTVAELVKASEAGEQLGATQLHRVIGRLVASGLIRRVELLHAYTMAGPELGTVIAVCSGCRSATEFETPDLYAELNELCVANEFIPTRIICEIAVRCMKCRGG